MPPSAATIAAVTRAYLARHPTERAKLEPLLAMLASEPAPTSRTTLPAHITCSAVVINREQQVLHIHHKVTGLTLCPGGHGEESDTSLLATAMREVTEEAGIPPEALCLVPQLLAQPVDIDLNDIDPNPDKGERTHQHYDFRFAFYLADAATPETALHAEEVTGCEWRPFEQVTSPSLRAKLSPAGLDGRPEPVNASVLIHDGNGRYLLHLRDAFDHIWAPGEFSLLGGGREPQDRTLEDTLRGELTEEAPGLELGALEPLVVEQVIGADGLCVPVQVYTARWAGDPDAVGLTEGVLLRWFTPDMLHRLRLRTSTRDLLLAHAAQTRDSAAVRPPAPRPPHRPAATAGAGLRRAVPSDAGELTRLRLVMLASAGTVPEREWSGECERWFADRLAGDERFAAFVIDDGTRLLSCAVAQCTDHMPRPGQGPYVGHIASVATDPAHRRQGHARRVVAAVHDWLTAHGCGQINLTASPDAEELYRSLGYRDPAGPTPLTWSAR
ncbi:GNAT family N-acetyltransferase [Kitasatospora sp. NPDC058190]|uniref:GNAT family N-acetyltransferase n=1 Tax=Kitasatospora sp. NPDC058190 TaxID=3346371 RepID=UPI0036D9ABAB